MIISRTPYRISFFGGGTDYPGWYREHGGAVLAATINKYCYLTCRYLPPFFEHRTRLVYGKVELCRHNSQISHPAVREVLNYLGIDRGLEIHHDGDLPARSGMGSSSAFTVGLLHALHALKGRICSKRQLALESIQVEQELLNETVGSQDQILAAFGGLRHVVFHRDNEISVHPLPLCRTRLAELNAHLMLFYTGIVRTASQVASSYVADIGAKHRQLKRLRELVDESLSILDSRQPLDRFGLLLHEGWQAKRSLSPIVSSAQIDGLYEGARSAGALGGKLTGAGGGGFLLLFVPPDRQAAVRERLNALIHVPFQFESGGSQIIFHEAGEDYSGREHERLYGPVGDATGGADLKKAA